MKRAAKVSATAPHFACKWAWKEGCAQNLGAYRGHILTVEHGNVWKNQAKGSAYCLPWVPNSYLPGVPLSGGARQPGQPIAYLACPCLEERGSRASLLPLRSNSLTFLNTKNNCSLFFYCFCMTWMGLQYTPVVVWYSNESGTVSTQSVHGTVTLTGLEYIQDNLFTSLFPCMICGKISMSISHRKMRLVLYVN